MVKIVKLILKQLKQYKKNTIFAPLFTALEVVMEVLLPFITAKIIDEGLQQANMNIIYKYGLIMIIVALLSLCFGALSAKHAATASSGLACNLRETMYRKIQTYSFLNIDKFSTAGLVTRLTTDVTNVQNAFQMMIRTAVRAPLMFIFSMMMCILINKKISLIFLVAILFLTVIISFLVTQTAKAFNRVFDKYDDLNSDVQENISGIRVVKAYVREKYEKSKFENAVNKLYALFVKAEGLMALNNPAMMLTVYACILAVSWFGAHFIVEGSMSTGQITSLFSYITSLMMSLMVFSMVIVMITMSLASIRRIKEVLEEIPDLAEPVTPKYDVKDGSIVFDNVSFSYKKGIGKDTLKNINIKIHSGEMIGIIGSTGSGKSSLVNLISRLYDVKKGRVLVGGVNVKDYDLHSLRSQVSVVLQNNVLFSGSILENLRWGDKEASEEQCIEACRLACADEFIEKMPDKYHTHIERGGVNISGGQKQRLCIARALLKKPKILIMDDSTSAVDTATDAKIRKDLRHNIPDTTKIIIAQRISSVQDADRIIVLNEGKIDAFDSHDNLLKKNKIYREIYESQTSNGGDFDE